jgi:transposase
MLELAFKVHAQIIDFWKFFVPSALVLLGWIFTRKDPWPLAQRVAVAIAYVGFVVFNVHGLVESYAMFETLVTELKIPTFDGHLNESNTDLRRCSMDYKPRRKLTREFKLEAVRQAALSEKPKAQLARELGVRVGQLRTWRLEFEKEAVTGIAKPDRSAAEDLEQLRRENTRLKMEIEILKKAAIYFAREAK